MKKQIKALLVKVGIIFRELASGAGSALRS